jgi:replication initiation protein RepC
LRYGKRNPKDRIIEAYGFDLAPIAARYAEFQRVAEEGRVERRAMSRLRRRATIARKAIIQILETAEEYGFEGEEWQVLANETEALARALKAVERVDEMEAGVTSLERRQTAARECLEVLLGTVETDPKGAENRPHIYNYKPSLNPQEDTVIAAKECSSAGGEDVSRSPAPVQPNRPEKSMVHGIAPDELVKLAPKLKPWLRRPNPTWPDIVDAADWLRHDLGVSKSLWSNACLAMGRELAAVALAIVSTKEAEHFRTSPGWLLPRHGRQSQSRRAASRTHGLGLAPRHHAGTPCGQGRGGRSPVTVRGLPSREIPHRRHAPPLPKPRTVSGRYRGPIPELQ